MNKKHIKYIVIILLCLIPFVFLMGYCFAALKDGESIASIFKITDGGNVKKLSLKNTKFKEAQTVEGKTEEPAPLANERDVYLTFDDGPGRNVTGKMLDILKAHSIKGTFFVIGNQIKGKEAIIKRIVDEGSVIGLHSYTHSYRELYKSDDSFLAEMRWTNSLVKKAIGQDIKIIRFPYGSKGFLNERLLGKIHSEGYLVYDWNADAGDGEGDRASVGEIIANATRMRKLRKRVILLMHCRGNNVNTEKALPAIIEFYKSKGYVFRTVTERTPELIFRYK